GRAWYDGRGGCGALRESDVGCGAGRGGSGGRARFDGRGGCGAPRGKGDGGRGGRGGRGGGGPGGDGRADGARRGAGPGGREAGARRLAVLPTGGRTPLAAGLALAARVLAAERLRDPDRRPLLVVVTDGRATSGSASDLDRAAARLAGIPAIVVDCESGMVRL